MYKRQPLEACDKGASRLDIGSTFNVGLLPQRGAAAQPEQKRFSVKRVARLMPHIRAEMQRISGAKIIDLTVNLDDGATLTNFNELFAGMAVDFTDEPGRKRDQIGGKAGPRKITVQALIGCLLYTSRCV